MSLDRLADTMTGIWTSTFVLSEILISSLLHDAMVFRCPTCYSDKPCKSYTPFVAAICRSASVTHLANCALEGRTFLSS